MKRRKPRDGGAETISACSLRRRRKKRRLHRRIQKISVAGLQQSPTGEVERCVRNIIDPTHSKSSNEFQGLLADADDVEGLNNGERSDGKLASAFWRRRRSLV